MLFFYLPEHFLAEVAQLLLPPPGLQELLLDLVQGGGGLPAGGGAHRGRAHLRLGLVHLHSYNELHTFG
jgi:hypothetical protein